MRFYDVIRSDYHDVFASAGIRGTYEEKPPCPKCNSGRSVRIPPLVIEWEPGSTEIGDFTWPCGLGEIVVTGKVKDFVESHGFSGVCFRRVEMTQDTRAKKPARPNSRTKQRIWLPYEGPPLWEFDVVSTCNLDLVASHRTLIQKCDVCQLEIWDAPIECDQIVEPNSWDGSDFFRIREIGRVVFVIEDVAKALGSAAFSNVRYTKRGTIAGDASRRR
jgi:hypothetical protein